MYLNKVFIVGNLTRDPESRSLPSGMSVVSVGIATNRVWNDQQTNEKKEEVEYHNVVFFGRLAEIVMQYLKKGSSVLVEGRLRTSSWDDTQTGQKKYKTEIIAESMQMGPRKSEGGGSFSQNNTASGQPPSKASNQPHTKEEIHPDDIPF